MSNPIPPDFIRGLLKNTILVQILLGFIAIVIASQGGIPWIAGGFIPLQPFWLWLFGSLGIVLVLAPIALQFMSIAERSRREGARIATAKSNSLIAREAIAGFKSAFESEQALRVMIDNIHQVETSRYQVALDAVTHTLRVKEHELKNLETLTLTALLISTAELNVSEENIKESLAKVNDALLSLVTMIPIPPGEGSKEDALESFGDGISRGKEPSNVALRPFFLAGKLYGEIVEMVTQWHMSINSIPSMFEEFRKEHITDPRILANRAVAAYNTNELANFVVLLVNDKKSTTEISNDSKDIETST